ncbi:MAG: PTS sugar transporter subunit IIA, partial [Eubacterium sp.]|nr:PTS sugar transporter subunit IIA [Eubacterium sp.]
MKITDLLKPEGIKIGATATDKMNAIDQLIDLQVKSGNVSDRETYKKAILAREEEGTTAMGDGIAIPHAKTPVAIRAGLAAMTVPAGVNYDAPDDEPSDLFFMIAAPDTKDNIHLEVLSRLATMLMDEDFVAGVRAAKTPEE